MLVIDCIIHISIGKIHYQLPLYVLLNEKGTLQKKTKSCKHVQSIDIHSLRRLHVSK